MLLKCSVNRDAPTFRFKVGDGSGRRGSQSTTVIADVDDRIGQRCASRCAVICGVLPARVDRCQDVLDGLRGEGCTSVPC